MGLKLMILFLSLGLLLGCEKDAIVESLSDHQVEDSIQKNNETPLDNCPKNFIPIQALDGVFDESFCVAKYEMKENFITGLAESTKHGTPWVNITFEEAVDKCRELGTGYELINNSQWQRIARLIADGDSNWLTYNAYSSEMTAYTGNHTFVNAGNNKKSGEGKLLSAGGDFDPCFGYDKAKCAISNSDHFYQKRTHSLPGKYIIWDFSGNASEWVMAKAYEMPTTQAQSSPFYVYELAQNDPLRSIYGNDQTCSTPHARNHYCGFGKLHLANDQATMQGGLRGGSIKEDSGIFSLHLKNSSLLTQSSSWRGFRCVYTPL